jgi:hypothetical protein
MYLLHAQGFLMRAACCYTFVRKKLAGPISALADCENKTIGCVNTALANSIMLAIWRFAVGECSFDHIRRTKYNSRHHQQGINAAAFSTMIRFFFWRKKQKKQKARIIIILQMSRAIIPDARWTRVISVARRGIISPDRRKSQSTLCSAATSLYKILYCVFECECRAVQ